VTIDGVVVAIVLNEGWWLVRVIAGA